MKKKFLILFCHATIYCVCLSAQPQQPPKPPTPEERLKHVSEKIEKEITLTPAQKTKVAAAYKDFFAAMEKLRAKDGKQPPPPPPPPVNKEEADKLSKLRDEKIRSALTEAQYNKYAEIEKSLRPPRPEGRPGPPPADKKE